jgi:murein DD-endopeptidase MepM/ murein hydrolase activator NlpD
VLRFLSIIVFIAGLFSFLIFILIGSPIEFALNAKMNVLQGNFLTLNNKIDSLENKLHMQLIPADKYYREILELDSVPASIRYAGSGGSEPIKTMDFSPATAEMIVETKEKVNALKKQIQIQSESSFKVFTTAVDYNIELTGVPAIQPVKPSENIWISSKFGSRDDPFTLSRRSHSGIDFVGPRNTEIYATAKGTVTLVKDSRRGYGKEVVITHDFGYSTRYAHLNEIKVKDGQEVKRGQLVGLMGSTGRSTGVHLHYEVRLNRRPINPIYYFADNLTQDEYNLIVKQVD